jgi:hypothetical protein
MNTDRGCIPLTICDSTTHFVDGREESGDLKCTGFTACDADTQYESRAPSTYALESYTLAISDRVCANTIVCGTTQIIDGVAADAICAPKPFGTRRLATRRHLDDGEQHWYDCESGQYTASGSVYSSTNQPVCKAISNCSAA